MPNEHIESEDDWSDSSDSSSDEGSDIGDIQPRQVDNIAHEGQEVLPQVAVVNPPVPPPAARNNNLLHPNGKVWEVWENIAEDAVLHAKRRTTYIELG